MAYRDSTVNSGNSTTPSVAVPTCAIGDIMLLACTLDGLPNYEVGDWPTGFTELGEFQLTFDTQGIAVGWKRLTVVDSGTYTFGVLGGTGDFVCQAFSFSGRHATDPPTISTVAGNDAGVASPVTVTANGVTAVQGDDLFHLMASDLNATGIGGTFTAPTNFTLGEGLLFGWAGLAGSYRNNVSAGATGSIAGSFTLSSGLSAWAGWTVRIPVTSVVATLDQEGFRWRNDDGTEATATWQAAQDAQMTGPGLTPVRLRFVVNATGDPATGAYQLEYRKVGESVWMPVYPPATQP
jgi:hypothetical protein